MTASKKATALAVGGTLVVAGFGAGAVLAATGSASATSGGAGYGYAAGDARGDRDGDGHRGGPGGDHGGGQGETPLTGATADKVEAAALATYPGATVDRLETDSEGVYEAHVTTADGEHVVVQVGRDFGVTGTQTLGQGGRGGAGGPGDHDGDRTGEGAPSSGGQAG